MAALSDLARAQIEHPLGRLEDIGGVTTPQRAIGNGVPAMGNGGGTPAIEGGRQGGSPASLDAGEGEEDDDITSEPTSQERKERQEQLDRDSTEFREAIPLGVWNGE